MGPARLLRIQEGVPDNGGGGGGDRAGVSPCRCAGHDDADHDGADHDDADHDDAPLMLTIDADHNGADH